MLDTTSLAAFTEDARAFDTYARRLENSSDNDLQRAAELALGDRNGAIVAMDPRTGEILALVSRPSFDPNAFAVRIERAEWNKLITDPDHPLMNKARMMSPPINFSIGHSSNRAHLPELAPNPMSKLS